MRLARQRRECSCDHRRSRAAFRSRRKPTSSLRGHDPYRRCQEHLRRQWIRARPTVPRSPGRKMRRSERRSPQASNQRHAARPPRETGARVRAGRTRNTAAISSTPCPVLSAAGDDCNKTGEWPGRRGVRLADCRTDRGVLATMVIRGKVGEKSVSVRTRASRLGGRERQQRRRWHGYRCRRAHGHHVPHRRRGPMYAAENKAQDLGGCAGPRGPRCYASVRLPRSTMGPGGIECDENVE